MIDWIKSLFGEGKIRVEGEFTDGTSFTAKVPYIGAISTMNETELFDNVKQSILVEHGKQVKTIRLVGYTSN